ASSEIKTDVRILSATHKDLASQVDQGNFRQDLFYRLNVIQLNVPALRDRPEDIPLLAQHLLKKLATDLEMDAPEISPAALAQLCKYPFPGNVRELENILERAFTLCDSDSIKPQDLQLNQSQPAAPLAKGHEPAKANHYSRCKEYPSLDEYLADIEKEVILGALDTVRWNKTLAAKDLGISFRSLRYRLQKLGLEAD